MPAARCGVPLACTHLTAMVDVHKELLFWCVVGWQDDFTGFIVDYGTFPGQAERYFTVANCQRTLSNAYPGMGEGGAIQAGLTDLVTKLLARDWPRSGGGGVLRIERLFVDQGYKPGIVAAVKHKAGGTAMMLYKGVGIRAGNKPMSTYVKKPGERHGFHWYMPSVHGTSEFPHVASDVNFWKTFLHGRFKTAAGDPGALTIFGSEQREHELFAEHVAASEFWTLTHGHGRDVQEWKQLPSRPDNHWLDCLAGNCCAASMLGAVMPGMKAICAGVGGPRKARPLSEMANGR